MPSPSFVVFFAGPPLLAQSMRGGRRVLGLIPVEASAGNLSPAQKGREMSKLPSYNEIINARGTLLELKMRLLAFQIQQILRKYRPDQLRVPAGNADGGQWVEEGGGGRTRIAGTYDPSRAAICEAQQIKDEELCRIARSPICWGLAKERYAACMRNNYLPVLRF